MPVRAVCWVAGFATLAAAHSFEPAILDLQEHDAGVFAGVWKSPAVRTAADADVFSKIRPVFPAHCRVTTPPAEETSGEGPLPLHLDCRPAGLRGETIRIDGLVGTRVDAVVRLAWRDGRVVAGVARPDADTVDVPGVADGAPAAVVLTRYGALGIEHILGGLDHLLFVLALLLLVERAGALVRTVTAFTVAHSLTLACAVLGVIRPTPAPVEAVIALSIVLLAAELARGSAEGPTLTRRAPWIVAFVFGLLHGFGFAGALADIGLPSDQVPLALLAFNGGVEIGQLGFVAAAALPVALWRRWARHAVWRLGPAYAIGTVAMVWTVERVLGLWG